MRIGIPYDYEQVVINKKNINKFVYSRFRRRERPAQVRSLKKALDEGKHFIMPLEVVRNNGGSIEMIDGNHRLSAIKKKIAEDPTFEIEVGMLVMRI